MIDHPLAARNTYASGFEVVIFCIAVEGGGRGAEEHTRGEAAKRMAHVDHPAFGTDVQLGVLEEHQKLVERSLAAEIQDAVRHVIFGFGTDVD